MWDDWHSLKSLEKKMDKEFGNIKPIKDNIVATKSHVYWCLRNLKISLDDYQNEDKRKEAVTKLQNAILNITRHFQGAMAMDEDENGVEFHENCSEKSRCRQDYYVLSKTLLTSSEADLLYNFLMTTDFIKSTEKYLLGGNTSNVESSHRGQNLYRDKQNHLSPSQYNFKIDLNTLHYQELTTGKYEDGVRKAPLEMSNGPVGNPKKERPKRIFVEDLKVTYFTELLSQESVTDGNGSEEGDDEDDYESDYEDNESLEGYENVSDVEDFKDYENGSDIEDFEDKSPIWSPPSHSTSGLARTCYPCTSSLCNDQGAVCEKKASRAQGTLRPSLQ